ncbi:MAG: hypothetical protein CMJ65_01055 [Planctomycetaceae bacterium]|nr:hypothetical protein [Planctomycetaceae bacterium]
MGGSDGRVIAQDADPKRLTFTDAASAGEDFRLQGEYVGWVLTGSQEYRPIGLQVIALGGGRFEAVEYAGGLPGAGAEGKARLRIKGSRRGVAARFVSGPLRIHVADDRAVLYLESIDGVIAELQKVDRVSATMGAKPPGGAVVLFDGTSADHFKGGKVTGTGLLIEGTETKAAYASFHLHLEFRLPFMPNARGQGRGNSGVYLQSRYEVQILDSFGLAGKSNECGGLYRYREPATNMCLPPLSWQTYDIDLTAARFDSSGKKTGNARLTVRHNGVVIHDDFEVERKTGAGKPEGPLALPTKLQNHSNPIRFRNIWLVDRSVKPTAASANSSPAAPVK